MPAGPSRAALLAPCQESRRARRAPAGSREPRATRELLDRDSLRSGMRGARPAFRDLEEQLVRVAPEPVLVGLEGLDQRVVGLVVVRGGVLVRRLVAAADVPTFDTAPEVH